MKVSPFETVESLVTTAIALVSILAGYAGLGYFGYHSYMEWYYVRDPEAIVSVGYIVITAIVMSCGILKIVFSRKEKVREWKDHVLE